MTEVKLPRGRFRGRRLPRRLRLVVVLIAAAAVGLLFLAISFSVYVEPNQYGIKEVQIGPNKGIQTKVHDPGLALVLKPFGLERMHLLPRDLQVYEMTNYPGDQPAGRQGSFFDKAAHIQTSDGFYVDVDVSVLFRIADPHLVITTLGAGDLYLTNGLVPKAEPALKEALGELTTEEFYISPLRHEKGTLAQQILNRELAPKGIEVTQLLIRYFHYSDEIQRNIEEKKLKDQLVFKNQAERRAAIEAAKLKKVVEEGKAAYQVKLEEGRAYVVRRRAEQEMYARTKRAEADLLIKLAEARRTELKGEALQAGGADRMVGLKMAEVLEGVEFVILPSDGAQGVNPLDLGSLMRLFDVQAGGKDR